MAEAERMAELVNCDVFDINPVGAAGPGKIDVILVQHDISVDEVTGAVVPPVGFADVPYGVVAEEHLVLVVPGERRAARRSAVDELNVRPALVVPCRGCGLDRRYGRRVRYV